MRQAEPEGSGNRTHPETLLDLWMGQDEEAPPPRRGPRGRLAFLLVVLGLLVVVLLAKYAVDLLGIVAVLVVVGVVLHVLGIRLAESDILSPGWFLILVLSVGLVAYAVLVPSDSVAGLSRYVPNWVLSTLEWSQERGWGQRMLVGPGAETASQAARPDVPNATAPVTVGTSSAAGLALVLTSSAPTTVLGEPVTLMARTDDGNRSTGRLSVRFYDGALALGTADMKGDTRTQIAYLTVRGLGVGRHEFRAEVVGLLGVGSSNSTPIEHTVLPRR